uniref:Uncharacterized protein n=1 Tax=Cannabis sativa TaxID=3483 RepID=A0A803PYB6_CANSA
MVDTKQINGNVTTHDPHTTRLAIRCRIKITRGVTLPHVDVISEIDHKNERPRATFNRERVVPIRRKRCEHCVILSNCPLGHYDSDGNLLSRLSEPLVLSLDHFLEQSLEPKILDITPGGITYLLTMFVLYKELGWPQPTPYEVEYYFDMESVLQQHRPRYFYFSQVSHQWLDDSNNLSMPKVDEHVNKYFISWDVKKICHRHFQRVPFVKRSIPTLQIRDRVNHILSILVEQRNITQLASVNNFLMYGLHPPTPGVARVLTVDEVCLGDRQGPDLDDDEVP